MLDLAVLSVFGFSGYAALLATAPLWAVNGGATAAGSGSVNGVLLAATVLAQLAVPRALASWGTGPVLVAGLLLLGVPAPGYLLSDGLGWVLGLSAVRGLGFGILTVVGSAVAARLVPASRRGAAIGVYGLAVAVPNLLLLPGSVPVVDRWGFAPVFWTAALPVLGVPSAVRLARVLRDTGHDRPVPTGEGSLDRLPILIGIVPPTVVLFSVTMAGGAVLTFAPQLTDPATAAPVLLIAAATALGLCYGALQNLTLVVAFAAVGRQQLPAASAVWNIGFDTGTASGAVLAGVLATAYSFPVSLATMAAFCLLIAVLAVVAPSLRRTTRR